MPQRPTSKASLLLSQTWGSSMQLSAFGLKQPSSTRYVHDPIQHLNPEPRILFKDPEMLTFYQIRFFCLRVVNFGSVKNWISCWNSVHFFFKWHFSKLNFFCAESVTVCHICAILPRPMHCCGQLRVPFVPPQKNGCSQSLHIQV